MHVSKHTIITVILWCIFATLLAIGFAQSRTLNRYPTASLRFSSPISGQTAHRVRQYSINNPDTFWPTFWHESAMQISANHRTNTAATISFSGDASLVWTAVFIAGSAPSSIDSTGIAVSEELALSLWGSTNIVGMTANINGEYRTVRGVFQGADELALLPFHIEDTTPYWTAVELSGGIPYPTRQDAETFAMMAGLGRPDFILMGGANAVARTLAILPILVPIIYVIALAVAFVHKHYRIAAAPLLFGGLILLAVALPILLNALPPWMIPNRWGDFAFWGGLGTQAADALREFLATPPSLRDVEFRMQLLQQIAVFIPTICLGVHLCRTRRL